MLICISINPETIKIWTPFLIALLVYFLSWRKSKLEKKSEIKTYRGLFINWIRVAKNRTMAQVDACEEFSKSAIASENIDREGITFSPLLFGKLNSISLEKSISAFVFNNSGDNERNLKEFNSIIVCINFFDAIEIEIKTAYNEYSQEMFKLNDQFNTLFISIESAFFKKVNEVGDDHGDPNFVHTQALNEMRIIWRDSIPNGENSNAIHTFDKLVKPSIQYVHEKFNQDKENKFLMEMYDLFEGMRIVERKWLEYKGGYSERIKSYGNQIKEAFERLEKTIEYFESNTEIVGIWEIK